MDPKEYELTEEEKEERSRYVREWKAKNPEKVAMQRKRYWARRVALRKEQEALTNGQKTAECS